MLACSTLLRAAPRLHISCRAVVRANRNPSHLFSSRLRYTRYSEVPSLAVVGGSTLARIKMNEPLTFEVGSKAKLNTDSLTSASPSEQASGSVTPSTSAPYPPTFSRLANTTCISRPTDRRLFPTSDTALAALAPPLRPLASAAKLSNCPSHVVIFGWMDAPLRLVAKYAQPYTILFPHATVLIKLSDGKSYLASESIRRQQLQTIIDEITSTASPSSSAEIGDSTVTLIEKEESEGSSVNSVKTQGVVIHSFSDGGAGNLSLFLDQMASLKTGNPHVSLPKIHSLIMDSSPGKSSPKTGSTAFTMHLAKRPRYRAFVRFFVWLGLWVLKIWTAVKGDLPRGDKMRRRLNSLKSWDWIMAASSSSSTNLAEKANQSPNSAYPPRMYMYTKSDRLIPWRFVEEHAREFANIRQPGSSPRLLEMEDKSQREQDLSSSTMSVELRRWDTPPHCSIGRTDFEGYWRAVMQFYQSVLA